MGRTAKLTISLPRELVAFADEIAKERGISRSKVLSSCLWELAERHRAEMMAKGYKAMAAENRRMAEESLPAAREVLPDWKE